jgi:hypothetical protein
MMPEHDRADADMARTGFLTGVTGSDVTPLKIVLVLFLFLVLVLGNSRKERTRTSKRTRTMAEELASLPVAPVFNARAKVRPLMKS